MYCPFKLTKKGYWQCPKCKYLFPIKSDKPPRRNCPKATVVISYVTERLEIGTKDTPSRGLGDTIAKIAKAIGIRPCGGCKKRQKKLNELIPYR